MHKVCKTFNFCAGIAVLQLYSAKLCHLLKKYSGHVVHTCISYIFDCQQWTLAKISLFSLLVLCINFQLLERRR